MSSGNTTDQADVEESVEPAVPSAELVKGLVRRISGVRSTKLRRVAVGYFVAEQGPRITAAIFEELLLKAARGDSRARDAWLAVAQWIVARSVGKSVEDLTPLREAAYADNLVGLASLLGFGPSRKELPEAARRRLASTHDADVLVFPMSDANSRPLSRPFIEAQYPRGHTMFHAPRRDEEDGIWFSFGRFDDLTKAEVRRFLKLSRVVESITSSSPGRLLTRRILGNRWLELRDLLVMVARRPQNSAVAIEVILSERWGSHPKVLEALASNPFTPTEVVLPLLPILSRPTLLDLASEQRASSVVSDAARLLVRQASPQPAADA